MAGLVDFHSHFFSRAFFEALASASPLPGNPADRLAAVAADAGLELPSPSVVEHLARWTAELDRYRVEHLVTFASAPEEADSVSEAVALAEGRLSGFLVLDPRVPEASERLAEALDERGFRGILAFPALHRYDLAGSEFAALAGVIAERGAIAIVHCGLLQIALRDRFGLPKAYDLRLANPLGLVPVAAANPGARFVIPHFGGGFFHETLMVGAQCPNVLVDTSSSNSWIATQPQALRLADVFERTLSVFGAERILFGTDSSVFPRGWRQDVLRTQREALGACGASEEERAMIFGRNASRLLGI